jgi:hypothetical protein
VGPAVVGPVGVIIMSLAIPVMADPARPGWAGPGGVRCCAESYSRACRMVVRPPA